jgi:hypothetical protein
MAISVILFPFWCKNSKARQRWAPAGLSNPVGLLGLPWNAKVRRHARHVMMVVMTMVDANWHLSHNHRMQAGGVSTVRSEKRARGELNGERNTNEKSARTNALLKER